jgi:hypothetical protein
MPRDDRALTRAARQRAAATPGENYTTARAALLVEHATGTATIDPALLKPYPDEDGVTLEELGWRVLPADASPEQRARAEAVWRPVSPDRPCRCSGPCDHGDVCEEECGDRIIHVDRYPGGMLSVDTWEDVYQCRTCGYSYTSSVQLPAVPFAEFTPNPDGGGVTRVFPGVRHPNFPDDDTDDGYDPGCMECGARGGYRCTCDDEPWRCEECGGDDSAYGCTC